MPLYLKFTADCSFSIQNINKCLLFKAQHHLHDVKYLIYELKPDLVDQIKKAEYTMHPDLPYCWKLVGERPRILLYFEFYAYCAIHFCWISLWLIFLHLFTYASGENYMAQFLCILLVFQFCYFFL